MNLLLDELPDRVEIGGADYPIHTDFRTAIQFELMMLDSSIPEEEKAGIALNLFFDDWPEDLESAVEAILAFYQCGREPKRGRRGGKSAKRCYSFEYDSGYIYAAFLEQYGIDLTEVKMHWWKFKALFESLSPDMMFVKIMGWRSAIIDGKIPPAEKKRLRELKEYYALPVQRTDDDKADAIYAVLMGDGDLRGLLAEE